MQQKLRETSYENQTITEKIRTGIDRNQYFNEIETNPRQQVLEEENRALAIKVNQLLDKLIESESFVKELSEKLIMMEEHVQSKLSLNEPLPWEQISSRSQILRSSRNIGEGLNCESGEISFRQD